MADYYTKLSENFLLPENAARWLIALEQRLDRIAWQEVDPVTNPDPMDAVLRELFGDHMRASGCEWSYDATAGVLAVWSDENADDMVVATLLQATLREFDVEGPLSLQWSNDCSKARPDAYGGGAVVLTQDDMNTIYTGEWITERLDLHQLGLPLDSPWKPIASAPRNGDTVAALTKGGRLVKVYWCVDFVETDSGPCSVWVAAGEGQHPDCWDDGVCWETNGDGEPSDPPVLWCPMPGKAALQLMSPGAGHAG